MNTQAHNQIQNHIAVDIGASSGRVVCGTLQQPGGTLSIEEIHRFSNGFAEQNGNLYWDIDYLVAEIVKGLQQAKARGIERCTVGIDTWGVDYVLLDQEGARIHEVFSYRDSRTDGAIERLHRNISTESVYEKVGIQYLPINTLYQLFVHDQAELEAAHSILLVPDYLYYRLTGRKISEVTIGSTSGMLNLHTRDYDEDLLSVLGLSKEQFPPLTEPGEPVGRLTEDLAARGDLPDCEFIAVASHDTASAVLGVPANSENWGFLSSGTWSLIGVERGSAITSPEAMLRNYTNEWGAYGSFRFLKNIMGMWLIQKVREEYGGQYSFGELVELAAQEIPFRSIIYCNDERFMNPQSMIDEIRSYCVEAGQLVPQTPGEMARCVFDSLALSYYFYIQDLQQLTGDNLERLHIVGGGANNGLLCQITADLLEMEIHAGPTESTALGNLVVQMISTGAVNDLQEAREIISRSFQVTSYIPKGMDPTTKKAALAQFARLQAVN
ncbi:rhamnulokinase [Paenibacillus odorifer]|uniref:rhamnulokinase n=1 Tax=Paenibacillus TaxID=44249 RepID=UPI002116CDED|nr:rhamnulokinase [Paenibacillus odorifer]